MIEGTNPHPRLEEGSLASDSHAPEPRRATSNILAIGIGLLACLIRLPWIGRLGLAWDEDISTLAARGILHTGTPTMPSGNPYWRAPLYHYLIAPLTAPEIDWLPRLLSVLISGITAFLIVRLGSQWVGRRASAIAGLFYVFSLVEIYIGRQTRMYSLYEPMALATLLLLFRFWRSGDLRWGFLAVGAILVTTTAHELAATLGVLFLPIALRHGRGRVWIFSVAAIAFLSIVPTFLRVGVFQAIGGMQGVPEPPPVSLSNSPLTAFRTMVIHDPLAFGGRMLGHGPFLAVLAVLGLAGLVWGWAATRAAPLGSRLAGACALGGVAVLAGAYEVGLAAGGLALVHLHRDDLFPVHGRRAISPLAVLAGLLALAWIIAAIASGYAVRDVLFGVLRRPARLLSFFLWPPFFLIGGGIALIKVLRHRGARAERADGPFFLTMAIGWLVLSRSVLTERAQLRFLIDLAPPWEILSAWGCVRAVERLPAIGRIPAPRARTAAVVAMAVLALLVPGTGIPRTMAYLQRGPGEAVYAGPRLDTAVSDLRGACDWLRPRLREGEQVVASDWLSTTCYLGRTDGWMRARDYGWQTVRVGGTIRDWYVGAELLRDLPDLLEFCARGPTWIVTDVTYASESQKLLDPEVARWLKSREPAFVAADGATKIYRVEGASAERRR